MWRSSRLLPWFNVYEEYFETEYNKFKNAQLEFDAQARHIDLQEAYPPYNIIDWDV
jgi:hypothetical protein